MNGFSSEHTKDLDVCLDGREKGRTTVGASFSMECLLCEDWCLSDWGGPDMGRKFGGAWERNQTKMNCDELRVERLVQAGELLLCFPIMDSGDVSSLLLRVPSSCQSEHTHN